MEIKPCPFCGNEKLKIDSKRGETFDCDFGLWKTYSYSVRCNKCHSRGPIFTAKYLKKEVFHCLPKNEEELKDEAIKLWNNRKGE